MDPTLQDVLARLDRVSGQLEEMRDGFKQAVAIADLDPDMALTRARKVLEFIVRDVFQRRTGEEAGTRPLENLLQRLVKDGYLPKRLSAYANAVRELGNVGTHAYGEAITKADVAQSLTQLTVILEWYFAHERPANGENAAVPVAAPGAGSAGAGAAKNVAPASTAAAGTARKWAMHRGVWLAGLLVVAVCGAGAWWWLTRPPFPPGGDTQGRPGPSQRSTPDTTKQGEDESLTKVMPPTSEKSGGKESPNSHVAGETPPSGAPAAAGEPKFQTVTSKAGRFTVEMPGEPKESIDQAGTDEEEHTFAVVLSDAKVFRVKYIDLVGWRIDPMNAQVILDVFREGFRQGAKFEGDKEITLKKYGLPGREYVLEAEKGLFVRERLFLSGERVYILQVVSLGVKDFLASKDADRFFDSFQVAR